MKEKFETVEFEIVVIEAEDVIATSAFSINRALDENETEIVK